MEKRNNGHWDELFEQCKRCFNLRVMSVYMDGNHVYVCGKYPLRDSNQICPEFIRQGEEDGEEIGLQEDGRDRE